MIGNTKRIFIMLGSLCNLSCTYCMQGKLKLDNLPKEINPAIYPFIAEKAGLAKEKLTITFYGGEPLLYLDKIKEIVNTLSAMQCNVTYSIVTNGKLINDEVAEYLNAHDFQIGVSYDGKASVISRGYDVSTNTCLLKLKHLGLTGVFTGSYKLSDMLTDYQALDDKYFAANGWHIDVNIDTLVPTNKLELDFQNIAIDVATMLATSDDDWPYVYQKYFLGVFEQLKKRKFSGNLSSCGNGKEVLNIDLQGNLYPCHNVRNSIGNIVNLDFAKYLTCLVNDSNNLKCYDVCKKCFVRDVCRGGCKLIPKERRANGYCELKKALYTPIIDFYNQIVLKRR